VIAVDLPRQYHRFVGEGVPVASDQPLDRRARLTDPENTVRIEHWRVALDEFKRERAHGGGAGTFEINWYRYRRTSQTVTDAHSLYIEVLGELGLVGIVLLLTAIVAILTGVARRVNGPDRALFATILAALAAWALAAGIDWHWEMPAVSLGFFALGGAALARRSERGEEGPALRLALRVALAGALCVVMVLGPLRLLISEDQLKKALLTPPTASCHDVDEAAAKATAAVASRPQPYEIRAACELKAGRPYRAIALLREAIRRDPALWRLHYALAVARARAGLDPRPAARAALALNPRELAAYTAVAAFKRQDSARGWRRASRQLQLLAPPL
jgi:tetratricopeptide (TPR) repeat protein